MLILVVVFFAGTFGLNFQMTSALMATQVFHKGAGEYGLLGIDPGDRLADRGAARRPPGRVRPRLRLVILAALAFGTVEIVAGLMPSYVAFARWTPLLGLSPR